MQIEDPNRIIIGDIGCEPIINETALGQIRSKQELARRFELEEEGKRKNEDIAGETKSVRRHNKRDIGLPSHDDGIDSQVYNCVPELLMKISNRERFQFDYFRSEKKLAGLTKSDVTECFKALTTMNVADIAAYVMHNIPSESAIMLKLVQSYKYDFQDNNYYEHMIDKIRFNVLEKVLLQCPSYRAYKLSMNDETRHRYYSHHVYGEDMQSREETRLAIESWAYDPEYISFDKTIEKLQSIDYVFEEAKKEATVQSDNSNQPVDTLAPLKAFEWFNILKSVRASEANIDLKSLVTFCRLSEELKSEIAPVLLFDKYQNISRFFENASIDGEDLLKKAAVLHARCYNVIDWMNDVPIDVIEKTYAYLEANGSLYYSKIGAYAVLLQIKIDEPSTEEIDILSNYIESDKFKIRHNKKITYQDDDYEERRTPYTKYEYVRYKNMRKMESTSSVANHLLSVKCILEDHNIETSINNITYLAGCFGKQENLIEYLEQFSPDKVEEIIKAQFDLEMVDLFMESKSQFIDFQHLFQAASETHLLCFMPEDLEKLVSLGMTPEMFSILNTAHSYSNVLVHVFEEYASPDQEIDVSKILAMSEAITTSIDKAVVGNYWNAEKNVIDLQRTFYEEVGIEKGLGITQTLSIEEYYQVKQLLSEIHEQIDELSSEDIIVLGTEKYFDIENNETLYSLSKHYPIRTIIDTYYKGIDFNTLLYLSNSIYKLDKNNEFKSEDIINLIHFFYSGYTDEQLKSGNKQITSGVKNLLLPIVTAYLSSNNDFKHLIDCVFQMSGLSSEIMEKASLHMENIDLDGLNFITKTIESLVKNQVSTEKDLLILKKLDESALCRDRFLRDGFALSFEAVFELNMHNWTEIEQTLNIILNYVDKELAMLIVNSCYFNPNQIVKIFEIFNKIRVKDTSLTTTNIDIANKIIKISRLMNVSKNKNLLDAESACYSLFVMPSDDLEKYINSEDAKKLEPGFKVLYELGLESSFDDILSIFNPFTDHYSLKVDELKLFLQSLPLKENNVFNWDRAKKVLASGTFQNYKEVYTSIVASFYKILLTDGIDENSFNKIIELISNENLIQAYKSGITDEIKSRIVGLYSGFSLEELLKNPWLSNHFNDLSLFEKYLDLDNIEQLKGLTVEQKTLLMKYASVQSITYINKFFVFESENTKLTNEFQERFYNRLISILNTDEYREYLVDVSNFKARNSLFAVLRGNTVQNSLENPGFYFDKFNDLDLFKRYINYFFNYKLAFPKYEVMLNSLDDKTLKGVMEKTSIEIFNKFHAIVNKKPNNIPDFDQERIINLLTTNTQILDYFKQIFEVISINSIKNLTLELCDSLFKQYGSTKNLDLKNILTATLNFNSDTHEIDLEKLKLFLGIASINKYLYLNQLIELVLGTKQLQELKKSKNELIYGKLMMMLVDPRMEVENTENTHAKGLLKGWSSGDYDISIVRSLYRGFSLNQAFADPELGHSFSTAQDYKYFLLIKNPTTPIAVLRQIKASIEASDSAASDFLLSTINRLYK